MLLIHGQNDCENSEQIGRHAVASIIPALQQGGHAFAVATNLRAPSFCKDPECLDVTREPDDTIVHDHDHHVLLMRTEVHVPDDTLICDFLTGVRALASAVTGSDIVRKIELADTADARVEEFNAELIHSLSFMSAGASEHEDRLMLTGHQRLRSRMHHAHLLRANIKYDVFRLFAAAQRALPDDARAVISWQDPAMDALLIGARAGHARSVLHVDPAAATDKELRMAMGTAQPHIARGLHYAAYPVAQ